jgi:hypothetical protein
MSTGPLPVLCGAGDSDLREPDPGQGEPPFPSSTGPDECARLLAGQSAWRLGRARHSLVLTCHQTGPPAEGRESRGVVT